MLKSSFLIMATLVLCAGCATVPTGPSVMVLPGTNKDFTQFQYDDSVCRQWASDQLGTNPNRAANDAAVGSAAVGTVVGAATGAAIGAAAGNPAMGAAVGSGVGLLGGTAAGSQQAQYAQWSTQRQYDAAYMQCMYAKGNQIPVRAGYQRPARPRWHDAEPRDFPPPPRGNPPPPPPGVRG